MFLQKFMIGIALSGVITPGVMQTTNIASSANNISFKTKQSNNLNPFNPSTFNDQFSWNGNYYAYYYKNAFKDDDTSKSSGWQPWPSKNNGYVLDLSITETPSLRFVYDWGKSHDENPNGCIAAYLTGSGKYTFRHRHSPLTLHFVDDASVEELKTITAAIANTKYDIFSFINNAIVNKQGIDFFIYSNPYSGHQYYAKATIANAQTGKSMTTDWYQMLF